MRVDNLDPNHIIAAEGKVFRRKSDGLIYSSEIYLGYTYYIGDERLDEPKLEVKEDFEEISEAEAYPSENE